MDPQAEHPTGDASPTRSTADDSAAPSTESSAGAGSTTAAPAGGRAGGETNGLPLTERLRLAREAAAAKSAAEGDVSSGPTAGEVEVTEGSPSGSFASPSSLANAAASARNPKFPPPLAMLLGKNSPAPSIGSPFSTARTGDEHAGGPASLSTELPSPAPTRTSVHSGTNMYDTSINSPAPAPFGSATMYPPPTHYRPEDDRSSTYGPRGREGELDSQARPQPPASTRRDFHTDASRDYINDRHQGPGPGPDHHVRRESYEPPSFYADPNRGRDPRADTSVYGRPARSPEPRDRVPDRRSFLDSRRDPRDDRDRDMRDPRDVRDRPREYRRDESPRRAGHGDGHRDRRGSRSPPPSSGAFVPKSPEVYVHPSRRPAVDQAASNTPGVYVRATPAPPPFPDASRSDNRYSASTPSSSYPPAREPVSGYAPHSSTGSSYDPHGSTNKRSRDAFPPYSPPPRSSYDSAPNGRGGPPPSDRDSRYSAPIGDSRERSDYGPPPPSRASGMGGDRRAEDEQDLKRRRLLDSSAGKTAASSSSSAHRDDSRRSRADSPPARAGGGSLLDRIQPERAGRPVPYVRKDGRPRPPGWRSRPCSYFIDGKRCPTADECNFRHAYPDDNGCQTFQAYQAGRSSVPCPHGDRCERSHSRDAPCLANMTPEGCPAKKNCGFRHTWYVAVPAEVGKQMQITEYRKTNPRPFPPGERDRLLDPPSVSTLESYRKGPAARAPSVSRSVAGGDGDQSDWDPRFSALVRALSDGRQELCSKAAAQILALDKAVYHKAGVENWSSFLGLAQVEGFVDLGRGTVPGREWVRLTAKALAQVPGRPAIASSQRSPSISNSGVGHARADRQTSQGSRADVEDQLDLTFDELVAEMGLPPPTEEQIAATNAAAAAAASAPGSSHKAAQDPSSSFNGYSSSPTKMASAPVTTAFLPASDGSAGGADDLADLKRQVAKLSQSIETLTEDLDYERKKRSRAEARAEEAEERAKVMEGRWKAASVGGK